MAALNYAQRLTPRRPSLLPAIGENQDVIEPMNSFDTKPDQSQQDQRWVPVVAIPSPPDGGWGWVIIETMILRECF